MKLPFLYLLLIACLVFVSCKKEAIVIDPQKEEGHKHLGLGVWADIDEAFRKSYGFDGFTGPGSSISVEVEYVSSKAVRDRYTLRQLNKKKLALVEFSEIQYGNRDSAFFTIVEDKRLDMYKYNMSIKDEHRVINVKAFCYKSQYLYCKPILRKSLLSTVIENNFESKQEDFLLVETDRLGTATYSKGGNIIKDGLDQVIYKTGKYKSVRNSQDKKNIEELVFDITGEDSVELRKEELLNGFYQYATSSGNGKHAFAAIIYDDQRNGRYCICHGSLETSLKECREFFIKNNIINE